MGGYLRDTPYIYSISCYVISDFHKGTVPYFLRQNIAIRVTPYDNISLMNFSVGDVVKIEGNVGTVIQTLTSLCILWYRVRFDGNYHWWCNHDEMTKLTDTELLKYRLTGKI